MPLPLAVGPQIPVACCFPAEGPQGTRGLEDKEAIGSQSRSAHCASCEGSHEAHILFTPLSVNPISRGPFFLSAFLCSWSLDAYNPEPGAREFWAVFRFVCFHSVPHW